MKRHIFVMTALTLASFAVLLFANSAAANYLISGTSGSIAGTNLAYSELSFTDDLASIKIRNNGLAVNFSSRIRIVDINGNVMMETRNAVEGVIPASGTAVFSDRYPVINLRLESGFLYQTQWPDMVVTPVGEGKAPDTSIPVPFMLSKQPQALEIQNTINRYLDERPLTQLKSELSFPVFEEGYIFWQNTSNGLHITMEYDSRTQMARLSSCSEFFAERLQRDRRYAQITADFERLLGTKPTSKGSDVTTVDMGRRLDFWDIAGDSSIPLQHIL